jgi:CcmD family protein
MSSKMWTLAIIPLIVWIGVFTYMLIVDRKLARLEALRDQEDV